MIKETIRPLLVEEVVRLKNLEAAATARGQAIHPGSGLEAAMKAQQNWEVARLKRAQAELQLWLADRQWEREEQTWPEALQEVKEEAEKTHSRIASPTTKP